MADNPFDQFDEQEANPFDQFDEPTEEQNKESVPVEARQAGNILLLNQAFPQTRHLPAKWQSKLASMAQGMTQGGTLGFSDEIVAGLASISPDVTFEEAIDQVRGQIGAAKESNPVSFFSGELTGGVTTGGAGVARFGATKAAVGSGAALGAGMDKGGVADRADGAALGGALGYAGARYLPVLFKGMKGAAGRILNNSKLSRADNMLVKAVMRENNVGRDEAINLIRNADTSSPDLMFQTLNLEAFAQGVSTKPYDKVRKTFIDAIVRQQRQQQSRIQSNVAQIIDASDFNALAGDIAQKKAGQGSALYTSAFEQPFSVNSNLARLSQRPSMKEALVKGVKLAADRGLDVKDNPLLLYHWGKMGLDDMIGQAWKKGNSVKAKGLGKLKAELLQEMDTVPQYAQARQLWAGEEANQAALEMGRSLLHKRVRADEVLEDVSKFSESERQHLLAGIVKGVGDRLEDAALTHDAAKAFNSERLRNVFRAILTDEQSENLIRMLDEEAMLRASGNRVRPDTGSPTALRQEAAKLVGQQSAGPVRRIGGRLLERRFVGNVSDFFTGVSKLVRREDPAVIEALAIRLSGSPDEAAHAFNNLSSLAKERTQIAWNQVGGVGDFIVGETAAIAGSETKNLIQQQP